MNSPSLSVLLGSEDEIYIVGREEALSADGLDLLWAQLLSSIESKLLLGCSSGKRSLRADELTKVGLVSNHAYSILDVRLIHGEK